jgi:hypothetical protein
MVLKSNKKNYSIKIAHQQDRKKGAPSTLTGSTGTDKN